MQRLVSALVSSRFDYYIAMLAEIPSMILAPLRRVLSAAFGLVAGLGPRVDVTEQIKELHWLPIRYRINFKLCLMMHAALTCQCPQYIRDIVHLLSALPETEQASSSCELPVRLHQNKICFRWKGIFRGWYARVEHFHKILQTSQTEKLLNELLRHII